MSELKQPNMTKPSLLNPANATKVGAEAILLESQALKALSEAVLGDMASAFHRAVEIMKVTKGRVIITGMGKSGHIGNKIAATLSSTGTPSFFVHPGEASHGDLGMITKQDTVIAMSNSGETAELADIVGYTNRYDIPLISMTSKPESTLAKNSTVALVLPKQPEACPHGLAPTTSSTMMIALGDALAMAILDQSQFSADDFGSFHPGGKLGQRLLKVEALMHKGDELPVVSEDCMMSEVILEMTTKGFGCAAVLSDHKLLGVITDGDLRRHMSDNILMSKAKDIMTTSPRTIPSDMLALDALAFMNEHKITALFVLDSDKCVRGVLHTHDCLRAGLA